MATEPLSAGPMPLYQQLKQRLRSEIARGTYRPGDRLPAEPELIQQFGVSRITVRQALGDLEAEGLVIRRHGKGTYVAERRIAQHLVRLTDFVEDMQMAGLSPSSRVLAFSREKASGEIAAALALPQQTEVVRIDRLRLANAQPIAYDITWLPLRYGALLHADDLVTETIYHILETRYAIPIEQGAFSFTAACATPSLAAALEIEVGIALLVIERVSYTRNDDPVYVQHRYYRTDRVRYQAALQRRADSAGEASTLRELRPVFRSETDTAGGPAR
jgi:GntR family transcriptional regulator